MLGAFPTALIILSAGAFLWWRWRVERRAQNEWNDYQIWLAQKRDRLRATFREIKG